MNKISLLALMLSTCNVFSESPTNYANDFEYLTNVLESKDYTYENKVEKFIPYLEATDEVIYLLGIYFIKNLYYMNQFPFLKQDLVLDLILKRVTYEIEETDSVNLEILLASSLVYSTIGNNSAIGNLEKLSYEFFPKSTENEVTFANNNVSILLDGNYNPIEGDNLFNSKKHFYQFFTIHCIGIIQTNEAIDTLFKLINYYKQKGEKYFLNLSVEYLFSNYKNQKAFEYIRDLESQNIISMYEYQSIIDARQNDLNNEIIIPNLIDASLLIVGFPEFIVMLQGVAKSLRYSIYQFIKTKYFLRSKVIKFLRPEKALIKLADGTIQECKILKYLKNEKVLVEVNDVGRVEDIDIIFPNLKNEFFKFGDKILVMNNGGKISEYTVGEVTNNFIKTSLGRDSKILTLYNFNDIFFISRGLP